MKLKIFSIVFLTSAICACSTQKSADVADVMTNEQLEAKLLEQQEEWNAMKPQLERILALEADLKLLVEALDTVPESSEALTQQATASREAQQASSDVPILPSTALIDIESAESEPSSDAVVTDVVEQDEKAMADEPSTKSAQALGRSKPILVQFFNEPKANDSAVPSQPFGVQLAAYLSFSQAQKAWPKLQTKNARLIKGLNPVIAHSVIRDRDFYRLIVGPIVKRSAGKALCSQLKKNNQDCLVTRFSGTAL
ncbi:SPOR domain-containing protein [Marinomonas mediterranea]|uniref:Sporulation domain-containing protein n=1 Tax=Marinomonas mediterranea (strain ATCC 700492 / JCM 21426 / NBRC 103028 / MMB-1) TaxID=717774 RepID=F2JUL4_MARM1|nr:SPOR domain-containing protein [Marinomonas mediterranea]ADZ89347.1 Sporulation domain-containing protein [Marinomonas mediterranea MMB-1]WCN15612.1 hypothetical protein GV053_00200 [Marinomonas mediterranea MMB-1]